MFYMVIFLGSLMWLVLYDICCVVNLLIYMDVILVDVK